MKPRIENPLVIFYPNEISPGVVKFHGYQKSPLHRFTVAMVLKKTVFVHIL